MKKVVTLLALILILSFAGCSNNVTQEKEYPKENVSSVDDSKTSDETNLGDGLTEAEKNFIMAGNKDYTMMQELRGLAVDVLGENRVENVAIDSETVKFLLTDPNPDNAALTQYTILYSMKDDYKMTVKFVFYKESGNVQTAYLRSTFNADTLTNFDWNKVNISNLKDYADEYNQF